MEKRINEIAIEFCQDYPDIENQKPFGQLWAIESTLKGTQAANEDCHKFIKHLTEKLGMNADQAVKEWESLLNEGGIDERE